MWLDHLDIMESGGLDDRLLAMGNGEAENPASPHARSTIYMVLIYLLVKYIYIHAEIESRSCLQSTYCFTPRSTDSLGKFVELHAHIVTRNLIGQYSLCSRDVIVSLF